MAQRSLVGLLLVAAVTSISLSAACPEGCHCLPDAHKPGSLKLSCQLSHLPLTFDGYPTNATRSLQLECVGDTARRLSADSFARFGRLRHLEVIGCRFDGDVLPAHFGAKLARLRKLRVSRAAPLRLADGALTGLRKVDEVAIVDCGLRALPASAFCALPELKLLNLSRNELTSLELIGVGGADCRNQLVLVDLSGNKLSRLTAAHLSQLKSLHSLRLSANAFETIAAGAFDERARLRELDLSANRLLRIDSLPPNIRTLDLSANALSFVPKTLAGASKLRSLNLSNNQIDENTPFHLSAPFLETLDVSRNRFKTWTNQMCTNCSSLTTLQLEHNPLDHLPVDGFRNLSGLTNLNLADGKLKSLPGGCLSALTDLRVLDARNNELSKLDDDLFVPYDSAPKLEQLLLSNNQLSQVPTWFMSLYHLSRLQLSHNRIAEVHKFLLSKLQNLEQLDLSDNWLRAVDAHVFVDLPRLRSLRLDRNRVEWIADDAFDGCGALEALSIADNLLVDSGGALDSLASLRQLNLTGNQLRLLDLSRLPASLNHLLVSGNEMATIERSDPSKRSAVQYVDASFNNLRRVPVWLPDTLVGANFSHNRIADIDELALRDKNALKWFDLTSNALRSVRRSHVLIRPLDGERWVQLHLAKNPLECSCDIDWFKEQQGGLSTSVPTISDYAALTCVHPLDGQRRLISAMRKNDLLCQYERECWLDCSCCQFKSCDCYNVCPDGCSCYRDSAYLTNVVKCSGASAVSWADIPFQVTELHLDGVDMRVVPNNALFGRYRLLAVYMNSSNISTIEAKAFSGLTSLHTLDLSSNRITQMSGNEFFNVKRLLHLQLHDNHLQTLPRHFFKHMPRLQSVTLHSNRIAQLPESVAVGAQSLYSLTLADNPYRCGCDDEFLIQRWLPIAEQRNRVRDSEALSCVENVTAAALSNDSTALSLLTPNADGMVEMNFWLFHDEVQRQLCRPTTESSASGNDGGAGIDAVTSDYTIFICIGVVVTAVVLALCLVAALHSRRSGCMVARHKSPPSLNSSATASTPVPSAMAAGGSVGPLIEYDAFVAYAYDDKESVEQQLTSGLEGEAPYYQLCLLYRQFGPPASDNATVNEELMSAVDKSHCLLLILTHNFLARDWKMTHVRIAIRCYLEGRHRPLVVVLDNSVDLNLIPDELGTHLRRLPSERRIRLSDPQFWDRLRQALPIIPRDDAAYSVYSAISSNQMTPSIII